MLALHSSTARCSHYRQIEGCPTHHARASHKRSNLLKFALLLLLTCLVFQANATAQLKQTRRVLILNELALCPADLVAIDREIFAALENAPYQIAEAYLFHSGALWQGWLKESDLPTGRIVLEPTFWEAYQRYVIAGVFSLLAQTLLIIALLWQRAKRRHIEAQLIRYSDQFRMAMESGKSVGWEWDLSTGRHTWFGDLRTMFGIPYDTFTGKVGDFFRYVHPEDCKRVSDAVAEARQERKTYMAEYRILLPDGTIRWIVERGKFEYATNGDP